MIFVTVGNHFQGFDRLIKKIDEIASSIPDEIVIQKGYSKYIPRNVRYFDFVPMDEAMEYIRNSRLVISHAGVGTIILCKEFGVPLLIVPRRKKYGEHSNDHQLEIAKAIEERGDKNISIVYEEEYIGEKILKILKIKEQVRFLNLGRENLIRTIKNFINSIPMIPSQ